jgi:MarR family transcriptional regulator for hemolysin
MELSESFVKTLMTWIEVFMRRTMRNFLLYSKQNGFSITQIAALFLIHRKGTISVSDIGDELEITNPAASQLLERLVQQGLVVRSEDPNDRRLKQIVLSKQGEVVLHDGLQARQKWLEDLVKLMSPDEQEQVIAALNIMLEKAHQLEYQPTPES